MKATLGGYTAEKNHLSGSHFLPNGFYATKREYFQNPSPQFEKFTRFDLRVKSQTQVEWNLQIKLSHNIIFRFDESSSKTDTFAEGQGEIGEAET